MSRHAGRPRRLVLASNNAAKAVELRDLLADSGWEIATPAELSLPRIDPIEGGRSYLENATIKATSFARVARMAALADDSGLEVDALDGRPGLFSARYGGVSIPSGDGERTQRLLDELQGVPRALRTARFRALIVLALPGGATHAREGVVEGRISEAARGSNGFGYDPIFELPDGLTMAEIGDRKEAISHRALAIRAMIEVLKRLS
jgi:XTP/dITP diphosphohydrolase